jgi:hypothetical protein
LPSRQAILWTSAKRVVDDESFRIENLNHLLSNGLFDLTPLATMNILGKNFSINPAYIIDYQILRLRVDTFRFFRSIISGARYGGDISEGF